MIGVQGGAKVAVGAEGGRLGELYEAHAPDAVRLAYLRTTVVNLARSHFRRRQVERAYVEREGHAPDPPEDPGGREDIWQALQRLRPRQRAAIVLRFYEDLTEAQTADILGCAVGTVKSLVSRGIDQLRGQLQRSE